MSTAQIGGRCPYCFGPKVAGGSTIHTSRCHLADVETPDVRFRCPSCDGLLAVPVGSTPDYRIRRHMAEQHGGGTPQLATAARRAWAAARDLGDAA